MCVAKREYESVKLMEGDGKKKEREREIGKDSQMRGSRWMERHRDR